MQKKARQKVKSEKKGFLWYSLRIGFVLMICYQAYAFLELEFIPLWIFGYVGLFLFLFNLIISIFSLFKLKKRLFAILNVILCLVYLWVLLVGFLS
ncbi:MAG: hypothetical protein AABW47_03875 [Nanoarchaeota archaeon]